ncbi:MAG: T9SS type A sorting domain-containing protein, partial [Bacteroidia bacterium]
VRIYKNVSGTWTQQGSDIDGEATSNSSGTSVSLSSDGSTVAIGAPANNSNGSSAGHVRIYKNVSGTWTQQGSDIDGEAAIDLSGSVSLSSDGSTVAIGARLNDGSGADAGHVRIYKNISGTWTQQGSDIDGEAAGDYFGGSVSLSSDGSTVAIGAQGNDGNGASAGHVRVYKNISGTWTQQGSDIDGEAASDYCGSVSLSSDGSTVAIGAYANDGNRKVNVGHVRVYSISTCITISSTDTVTSCGAYTWTNGVTYTESNNTALDTFVNGLGCDSIVTLNLTINSSSSFIDNITACDSFKWTDGNNYTSSNTTAMDTFVNAVGCDSVVTLNLTILKSTTSQVTDEACDEYASASGQKWFTSGTYTDTIVNAVGCDSIITYVLTIIDTDAIITSQPIDSTFNISSDARFGVSSQYNDAAYQWETDLGFGFQILTDALQYSGANTRVLTIGSITMINNNQPFRVIVSASNCIDTSDIATLTVRDNASIDGRLSSNLLSVYPNPANDLITIDVDASLLGKPFEIYNTKGQVVTIGILSSVNTTIDLEDYKSGIYFIKVGDEQQYSIKLIKE